MTDQPQNDGATDQFLSRTGNVIHHLCHLDAGHPGNHQCGCSAVWPRRNAEYEAWHANNPTTPSA